MQINLARHQYTELPAGKYKKKKSSLKSRQSNYKNPGNENPQHQANTRNGLRPRLPTRTRRGVQSMEIQLMQKAFSALQKSSNIKLFTSLDTLPAFVIRKSNLFSSQGNQRCNNYKHGQYMQKKVSYAVNLKITAQVRFPFACRLRCSAHKLIFKKFPGLTTYNKSGLSSEVTSYKKLVSKSKTEHLCRYQHYACQCV